MHSGGSVRPMRAIGLAFALAGCAATPSFWRAPGDGGWSASRRSEELGRVAKRAGVMLVPPEAGAPAPSSPPSRIDLAEALARAARANRTIAAASRDVEIAGERVTQARSGLLPSTTASGRYTWYTDSQRNSVRFPGGVGPDGGGRTSIEIRDRELGVLNGTITLPLDLSGALGHSLASAQAGYRGDQARLWATTLEQQLAVVTAYYRLLEAEKLRDVTRQNVGLYREQHDNAASRFRSGRLTKNELLVVEVAMRTAEEELPQRELEIVRARHALNRLIGESIDAPTEPVDVAERPEVPAVDDALRTAYAQNPLIVSLLEEQQRIEESRLSTERGRLPRLSAGAAIDYSSSDLLEPREIGSGFVGFTWDLGTDLRRRSEIAEKRIAAERNRVALEEQLRELEAGVRETRLAAEERLAALRTAELAVTQAEENLRIRRQQFDVGRASSEDVLDAQALLSSQRALRASALYGAHVRSAELRRLMGLGVVAPPPSAP